MIRLEFVEGPQAGSQVEVGPEGGDVPIGRAPGEGGVVLEGDSTVGRQHGLLRFTLQRYEYLNLSANGTLVNDVPVTGSVVLETDDTIRIGRDHLLRVTIPGRLKPRAPSTPLLQRGPFANPVVRFGLLAYLAGLVVLVVVASRSESRDLMASWSSVKESYLAEYEIPGKVAADVRDARAERAERLVRELIVFERQGRNDLARLACDDLMALDGDPGSPIFRFAARYKGRLKGG